MNSSLYIAAMLRRCQPTHVADDDTATLLLDFCVIVSNSLQNGKGACPRVSMFHDINITYYLNGRGILLECVLLIAKCLYGLT